VPDDVAVFPSARGGFAGIVDRFVLGIIEEDEDLIGRSRVRRAAPAGVSDSVTATLVLSSLTVSIGAVWRPAAKPANAVSGRSKAA